MKDLNKYETQLVRWELRERIRATLNKDNVKDPDPRWQLHSEFEFKKYKVKVYYDLTLSEEEMNKKRLTVRRILNDVTEREKRQTDNT